MAMFEKVTEHVISNAGSRTLHPVADINSAERYSTLCLVERRKAFWFWKQPQMVPTFVTLKDILVDGGELKAKEEQFTLLKNLEDNPKLNMSGSLEVTEKFAKKIAAQADISLGGQDTMNMDINLGDIVKMEVPYESLRESLATNAIDTSHPLYVSIARNSPKTSLCVVMETLATKDDGQIKRDSDVKANASAGVSSNIIKIDVKAKGSVESSSTRSYAIPSGTVLAYSCIEVDVDFNGKAKLHVIEDTLDQTTSVLQMPDNPLVVIQHEFAPLSKLDHFHQIQEEVKALLSNATETDFRVLHILLYNASLRKETFVPVSRLNHLLGTEITTSWKTFATLLGFTIREDPDAGLGECVLYPSNITQDVFKSGLQLVDSILDCFSNNWKTVPHLSLEHSHIIMKLIEKELKGKSSSNDHGADVQQMIKKEPTTRDFLKGCGFKESLSGAFTFTGKNSYHLLDVYAIMYFLSLGISGKCMIL